MPQLTEVLILSHQQLRAEMLLQATAGSAALLQDVRTVHHYSVSVRGVAAAGCPGGETHAAAAWSLRPAGLEESREQASASSPEPFPGCCMSRLCAL